MTFVTSLTVWVRYNCLKVKAFVVTGAVPCFCATGTDSCTFKLTGLWCSKLATTYYPVCTIILMPVCDRLISDADILPDSAVVLDAILMHFLLIQHCFDFPEPPYFTSSLQVGHFPQSFAVQPLQVLHLFLLCLFPTIEFKWILKIQWKKTS